MRIAFYILLLFRGLGHWHGGAAVSENNVGYSMALGYAGPASYGGRVYESASKPFGLNRNIKYV